MDINLPLILFIATVVTGFFYVVDIVALRRDRLRAVREVEEQHKSLDDAAKKDHVLYQEAIASARKEPAVIEYSKSFFPVLALVFVVRSFLFEPFQIPSESMLPTLEVGDFILVNKYTYGIRLPLIQKKVIDINPLKRGDVVVFFPPHVDQYYIKRLIGLPGDVIRIQNNVLFVNGEQLPSTFLSMEPAKPGEFCYAVRGENRLEKETLGRDFTTRECTIPGDLGRNGTWKVPEGHYFMMGDNRDNSTDSRRWGYVPDKNIVGKAVAIWMNWQSVFSIPSFNRAGKI